LTPSKESSELTDKDRESIKACKELTGWQEHQPKTKEDNTCCICMTEYNKLNPGVILSLCPHHFHATCLIKWYRNHFLSCPLCSKIYGTRVGDQPDGSMTVTICPHTQLPIQGYNSDTDTIMIVYSFPSGIQHKNHPNPGQEYEGTERVAYLPNNQIGQKVLELFKIAFERKLLFRIGTSVTTGNENQVIWNGVHMKTQLHGGPASFGYPDEGYFDRVMKELAARGVV